MTTRHPLALLGAQRRTLELLGEHPLGLCTHEIQEELDISKGATNARLRRLLKQDFVKRALIKPGGWYEYGITTHGERALSNT